MSDEFTTNENGSKTPEETNFQDYTAPENEIVQNETSQMTQEQPETSYGATSAEENPQPDSTAYAYGQTAYQQAYQSEQSQPNAYQQAYYGQTQAKGTGTGFGIASLVLGILSVFTFACCINYILAVLAIIFGIVQMVKNEKKGLAIGALIHGGIGLMGADLNGVQAAVGLTLAMVRAGSDLAFDGSVGGAGAAAVGMNPEIKSNAFPEETAA